MAPLGAVSHRFNFLNNTNNNNNNNKWNIRMDLAKIGVNAGNWVDSAQDRNYWRALVIAALNLRVS